MYFIIYYRSRIATMILVDLYLLIMLFKNIKIFTSFIKNNHNILSIVSNKNIRNVFNKTEISNNSNIIVNNNLLNSNENIVSNEEIKYNNKNLNFFEDEKDEIYCNMNNTEIVNYSVTVNNVLASFTSPKKCKKSRIIASFINLLNRDIDCIRIIYSLGKGIYMKKYKWPWSQVIIILDDKEEIPYTYLDMQWGYKYKYIKISLFIQFLKEYDREYINRFLNESILFFPHVDWNTLLVLFKENNIDVSGGDKSMRDKLSINQYKLSIACFFLNIKKVYIAWNMIRTFKMEKWEKGEKENILKYLIETRNDLDIIDSKEKISEFKNTIGNVKKRVFINHFVTFVSNFLGKNEKRRLIACKYTILNNEISIENIMDRQKKTFVDNEMNLPWFGVIIIFNEENINELKERYLDYKKYNVFLFSLNDFIILINSGTQETRNDVFNEFLFFFYNFEWNDVKDLFKVNDIFISKGNKNLRHLLSVNHSKLSLFLYILGIKKFNIGLNFHKK